MFIVKICNKEVTISIDSNQPDVSNSIQVQCADSNEKLKWEHRLFAMRGFRGLLLGGKCSPLDLNAALINEKINFDILTGKEVLNIPQERLPTGAIW